MLFVVFFVLSCQRNQKAPRPLDVTQKLLREKGGEFQGLNGFTVKLGNDKKLVFSKRFISRSFYYQSHQNSIPSIDLTDVYCMNTLEMDIDSIQELTVDNFAELYTQYNYKYMLDSEKPVFVFNGSISKRTATVYEDSQFSTPSKLPQSRSETCESEDSDFQRTSTTQYIAQYLDENTLYIFSQDVYNYYNQYERPTPYYRSISAASFSSIEFSKNFPNIPKMSVGINLPSSPINRMGYFAFSKDSKKIDIDVPDFKSNGVFEGACHLSFSVNYSDIVKKNMISFPLLALRVLQNSESLSSNFNFFENVTYKVELLDDLQKQDCKNELSKIKVIESSPEDFVAGFHNSNGQDTFFIYSLKTLNFILRINISNYDSSTTSK